MRYRFLHRSGNTYVWESTTKLPGDSRVEQVRCNVDWFWGRTVASWSVTPQGRQYAQYSTLGEKYAQVQREPLTLTEKDSWSVASMIRAGLRAD